MTMNLSKGRNRVGYEPISLPISIELSCARKGTCKERRGVASAIGTVDGTVCGHLVLRPTRIAIELRMLYCMVEYSAMAKH